MFLLDTNAISALGRLNHGKPNVLAWAARINLSDFFLSTIIVFEIERGILLLNRRDPSQAAKLRAWMDDRVMADFADRILPVDIPVARRCAALHLPDLRTTDSWGGRRDVIATVVRGVQKAAIGNRALPTPSYRRKAHIASHDLTWNVGRNVGLSIQPWQVIVQSQFLS